MTDRKSIEPFAGDDDDGINLRDFLKRVQHYLLATAWEDEEKINYSMEKLAKAIPDNSNLLVVGCQQQLPPTLKALVSSSHDMWMTFCMAVHTICPLDIEEKKEKQDKQAQIEGELQHV